MHCGRRRCPSSRNALGGRTDGRFGLWIFSEPLRTLQGWPTDVSELNHVTAILVHQKVGRAQFKSSLLPRVGPLRAVMLKHGSRMTGELDAERGGLGPAPG